MKKTVLSFSYILLITSQVSSQYLPGPTEIIESPRNVLANQINQNVYRNLLPAVSSAPSTTIITDCSPATCKNLADTLQLMIVSNLIQNTRPGSPLASQLSAQIVNDLFSSGSLPCGCPNPFVNAPNIVPNTIPNFIPNSVPNFIPNNIPNFIPNNIPNFIPNNIPNFIPNNIISPNFIPPNVISPNFISPNLISPNVLPNIVSAGVPSANPYPINIANLMAGLI